MSDLLLESGSSFLLEDGATLIVLEASSAYVSIAIAGLGTTNPQFDHFIAEMHQDSTGTTMLEQLHIKGVWVAASTITLPELAAELAQLILDLKATGLIKT